MTDDGPRAGDAAASNDELPLHVLGESRSSAGRSEWTGPFHKVREATLSAGAEWTALSYSSDGTQLAASTNAGFALVWELATGAQLLRVRHRGEVWDVCFSPGGDLLATASGDHSAVVWEFPSGREVTEVVDTWMLHTVGFSPDGSYLVSDGTEHVARVWELPSGRPVGVMQHGHNVSCVAFSPDGKLIATASNEGAVFVWQFPELNQYMAIDVETPQSVQFSSDGSCLAVGGADQTARVWELETGRLLVEGRHRGWVTDVAFSPDTRHLASGGWDCTVRIWRIADGVPVAKFQAGDAPHGSAPFMHVAFSALLSIWG